MSEFYSLAKLCEKLRVTSSKNSKVQDIAQYLAGLDERSLTEAVLFLSGSTFPKGSGLSLNLGQSTIFQLLSEITLLDPGEVQKIYLKHGDMGALAEYAISKKQQRALMGKELLILDITDQLRKIADASGSGASMAKRKILKGLLLNCSPLEAKYLIKIISGELRVGAVEGLIELAIANAFGRELQAVRQAMLLSGDISQVASLAKNDLLSTAVMKPLSPLSFMLADVMFTPEEIAKYYNKLLLCEFKYDGIRVQLHKMKSRIRMFSRILDDVTESFPEIQNASAPNPHDFILDGEVIAYKNDRPMRFQELQKRLKRKSINAEILSEIPVAYVPYDILYLDGESLTHSPLAQRKKLISKIKFERPILDLGFTTVGSAEEISKAFQLSRQMGHEGLVLKEPESLYHPGKRGRHWVKLKGELDTVDAVIINAEYGHGKRAGMLSDYTFAVKDGNSLRTIGKAYVGLTDSEIADITAKLLATTIKNEGYRLLVRPEIVIEVAFDSIQKSDRHDSGFALRFPRIKQIRSDKRADNVDSIEKVRRIYEMQFHVKSR